MLYPLSYERVAAVYRAADRRGGGPAKLAIR